MAKSRKTKDRLRPIAGASGQPLVLDQHSDGPPSVQRGVVADADGLIIRDPMVERVEWPDPDDMSARLRRAEKPGDRVTAKKIRGWQRVWTISTLHKTLPDEITEEHVRAATRLVNDHQQREGANTGGSASGSGDAGPEDIRVAAGIRYDEATATVGDQGSYLLFHIAILNWSLTRTALHIGVDRNRTLGRLQGALERLREHYDNGKKRKTRPSMSPTVTQPTEPENTGLPPDRSGRWDRRTVRPAAAEISY